VKLLLTTQTKENEINLKCFKVMLFKGLLLKINPVAKTSISLIYYLEKSIPAC